MEYKMLRVGPETLETKLNVQPKEGFSEVVKILELKNIGVNQKALWRGVLIAVLCVVLATPTEAKGLPSAGAIVGAIVGAVAAAVVITVVVVHESTKKRAITGCVNSAEGRISVTDEKDKRTYALTGNTADVKPGDRMTLHGKKAKPVSGDQNKMLGWEVQKVTRDFGACQH